MKTFEIRIKSVEQADREFIETFNAVREGRPVTPRFGTYFTSLEAVRNLLTEKRLALLHLIREQQPKSIYELSKLAGRDFKNVHTDVMLLKRYGLVQLDGKRKNKRKKRAARKISVPYQAINIHAVV